MDGEWMRLGVWKRLILEDVVIYVDIYWLRCIVSVWISVEMLSMEELLFFFLFVLRVWMGRSVFLENVFRIYNIYTYSLKKCFKKRVGKDIIKEKKTER